MCDFVDDRTYFRSYRQSLGFSNQSDTKKFLSGKNVPAGIDYKYIDRLNSRLIEILTAVNNTMHESVRHADINTFCSTHIDDVYSTIHESGNLPRLNNQGRRPEQVLYSWLRGYSITRFLSPSIAQLFKIDQQLIKDYGDDDFRSLETFRRTPKADLQLSYNNQKIVIEVQSGFQGINDIKQHKVLEAKRLASEEEAITLCMHFDVFNGQVAYVRLDTIAEDDLNWITRQQMEGQTVFEINQNYFAWRIMNSMTPLAELDLGL